MHVVITGARAAPPYHNRKQVIVHGHLVLFPSFLTVSVKEGRELGTTSCPQPPALAVCAEPGPRGNPLSVDPMQTQLVEHERREVCSTSMSMKGDESGEQFLLQAALLVAPSSMPTVRPRRSDLSDWGRTWLSRGTRRCASRPVGGRGFPWAGPVGYRLFIYL